MPDMNITSALNAVDTWLSESGKGVIISIEVLEMTRLDFLALPEYEGP